MNALSSTYVNSKKDDITTLINDSFYFILFVVCFLSV